MIQSIKLGNLRNGEYSQFLSDVLKIVEINNPAQLQVQEQYDSLRALFLSIEGLFKVPTGSVMSTQLEELDLRRDNAINGIYALINANTYSTDAATRANAELLANHLAVFGSSIARDNYQSETASIRNIIADWNTKPNLAAAIAALGLTAWKAELEAANNQFGQLYLSRALEMGSDTTDSIRSKRLEANEAWYKLRDFLDAYNTINKGADPFGKTVSFINGLLDNYNTLLARRTGNGDPGVADAVATAPAA